MWRLFSNVGADEKPKFFLLGLNKHLIYIGKLVDAFDNKQHLITTLRNVFPCGTLTMTSIVTNSLVNQYWEQ